MKPKVLAEINVSYKKFKAIVPDSFSLKSYVTIYYDFQQLKKTSKKIKRKLQVLKKKELIPLD